MRVTGPNVIGPIHLMALFGSASGLQNFLPKFSPPAGGGGRTTTTPPKASSAARELEDQLLNAIENLDGRLANSDEINSLVSALEDQREACISQPAIAPEVYGRWKLLYTTNAETASPIQRKAVDTSAFPIYQDIVFNEDNQLVVSQVVKFSDSNELRVDALASTSAYPLPELTERKSTGKVLGLNLLGVSFVTSRLGSFLPW